MTRAFLRQWLYAAACVTAVRLLNVAGLGHDLGHQMLAAQNLLAGRGLSLFEHHGADLAEPAHLVTLTHFPAGYSLIAAGLFGAGLEVGFVIKLLGAAATMVGWLGWARLAVPFFVTGLNRSRAWTSTALVVATLTPLLFTPAWGATDIFLWAAVPWVLECLIRGCDASPWRGRSFDTLAGILCGLALLMRYAGLFLVVYAAIVVAWQSRRQRAILIQRWSAFTFGVLPAFAVQSYVNYVLSEAARPGGLSFDATFDVIVRRLFEAVSWLHAANYIWAFWIPGRAMSLVLPTEGGTLPWQLGITVAAAVFFIAAATSYRHGSREASSDPRALALGLLVVLPVTLVGSMALGRFNYVAFQRYYWPVIPLAVFVAYSTASMSHVAGRRTVSMVLKAAGLVYITAFVAVALLYVALMCAPDQIGASQRPKLMGHDSPEWWPSRSVVHELSPARQVVMSFIDKEPNALLMTSRLMTFVWDPRLDRSRLLSISCEEWRDKHVSGPVSIIIHTFDEGRPEEIWSYADSGSVQARCLQELPNLRLVQRFPNEGIKVFEARVETNQRVALAR